MIHEIVEAIHGIMPLKEVTLLKEASVKPDQHAVKTVIQLYFRRKEERNYPSKWEKVERRLKRKGWITTSVPGGLKLEKGKTLFAELDLLPPEEGKPQIMRKIKLTGLGQVVTPLDEEHMLDRIRLILASRWNLKPNLSV